jgi:hypothetical protein
MIKNIKVKYIYRVTNKEDHYACYSPREAMDKNAFYNTKQQ